MEGAFSRKVGGLRACSQIVEQECGAVWPGRRAGGRRVCGRVGEQAGVGCVAG